MPPQSHELNAINQSFIYLYIYIYNDHNFIVRNVSEKELICSPFETCLDID